MNQAQRDTNVWSCKIGYASESLPLSPGENDAALRSAVEQAFEQLTGRDNDFIFSGWGRHLTEAELAVVEGRVPEVKEPRELLGQGNADATAWAHAFVHTALTKLDRQEVNLEFYALVDEDLLLGWFAAAIEAGRIAGRANR